MAPHQSQQAFRIGLLRSQAGDPIGYLFMTVFAFEIGGDPPDPEHLRSIGETDIAV